jgi:hypothetical protein
MLVMRDRTAVRALLAAVAPAALAVYVGDDQTDEEATSLLSETLDCSPLGYAV